MIFAAELHIPPWRIGDLTVDQFRQAIAAFEKQQEDRERAR
jgi:hypothetical protein